MRAPAGRSAGPSSGAGPAPGHRPAIAADLTGRVVLLANRLDLTYHAIRAGAWLVRTAPPRLAYAAAAAIADLVFAAWRGIRRRTTANMSWVVGQERAEAVAAASFRNYLRYLVEFLRFPSLSVPAIERAVEVRGVAHLHAAMARGRGAIAIGFHIGNIDLGAAVLAMQGYPVQVVVDRFEPASLDRLIQGYRRAKGLELIPLEQAPRRGLRALRDRQILALLIDKPTPGAGVVVDFFGGPIEIPSGAAVLALRTGAPVVPCVVWRTGIGRFVAEVAPPIDPSDRDARALTQRLVAVLEGWVRRDPAQWYPFRRMWLDRPDG